MASDDDPDAYEHGYDDYRPQRDPYWICRMLWPDETFPPPENDARNLRKLVG